MFLTVRARNETSGDTAPCGSLAMQKLRGAAGVHGLLGAVVNEVLHQRFGRLQKAMDMVRGGRARAISARALCEPPSFSSREAVRSQPHEEP
jgi:hypothetical protein